MNTDTLRQIFQSPFNYPKFSREIVHDLFGCNDVYETLDSAERLNPSPDGDQNYFLGQMEDADKLLLGFFYTRVAKGSDVRRKRVGLRKLIQPYLKYQVEAAIAVFDDGKHWRLSYICDHKEGTTSAKRFSYILGDRQGQYKTPMERLDTVAAKAGHFKLDDLKEAFSVDALSKEFFDEYHRHYDRIIAELARQGNTGAVFHDYVKKMMGRIVFLHFLQKKSWLNDDTEFLSKLFFLSPYKQDFLEQELEPLFFGIFNTEPDKRKQLFQQENWDLRWLEEWKRLPYLNGGLFERDEVDKMKIKLPASLFENLFKFMASYNFTIDENDPDDADIGIDPEMLGKIFESLLEDNKANGAFYTPKEIVRYMCKESLIAYLDSKLETDNASEKQNAQSANNPIQESKQLSQCGDTDTKDKCVLEVRDLKQSIRDFVEQHEFPEELEPYRTTLDTALREVKICDPAIGSGAFPMGLLNELWRCREAIENVPDELDLAYRAELKKEIIENNIYGVDIEKGAIDIARLRFWLSIVVDAERPEPLPNFDYKFMQGNSLIESYDGHDLSYIMDASSPLERGVAKRRGMSKAGWGENQTGMEFGSEEVKQNLRNWLKMYFSLTDHKEKAYYRELINSSVKNYIVQQGIGPAAETRLNAIDPSANKHFFLWHTWFKDIFDKGGFDIVIGNPPYINIANLTDDYARIFYQRNYKTVKNKCDLYSIFTERAYGLLRTRGLCSFIFSNSWLGTDSFSLFRKFLVSETTVIKLVDLPDKVFENATVKTCIILFSKGKANNHTIILENYNGTVFYKMVHSLTYKNIKRYDNYPFSFEQGIDLSKVEVVALGDIAEFSLGIKTSNDKKFISNSPFPEDSYRLIRGRNIQRYNTPLSQEWIWYRPDLFMEKVGAGPRKLENFLVKQKILIQDIAQEICATIDSNMYLCNDTINLIFSIDDKFKFEYILGLLNSKPVRFWHKKIFPEGLHIKIYQLKEIPIPVVPFEKQDTVVGLVNQILFKKKSNPSADTSFLEYEIDKLVYQLYNLTPEEIEIIETTN
jgi:type I restriction-modification system DNA methylase subunit